MSQNIDQILNELKSALKTSAQGGMGISDTASRQQVSVSDNGVVMTKLRLDRVLGDLTVEGKATAGEIHAGNIVANTITAAKELVVDTLKVKRVISEQEQDIYSRAITFNGTVLEELNGKGLLFSHPNFTHQLVFRNNPEKFFSTDDIDLYRGKKYFIDGVAVIEAGRLGDSITRSKLTKVGVLESLDVAGALKVGETLLVNDDFSRVGINTENLHGVLTVADGDVEFVIATDETGRHARIGTWGPGGVRIITDNTDRITVSGSTVQIGDRRSKNSELSVFGSAEVHGDLKVHGVAYFDRLVSDSRVERSSSFDFVSSDTESVYGKGLRWRGEGVTKQIFLATNFDRFISTESIDLQEGKGFYVNKRLVINNERLGDDVKHSNLTSVGELTSLSVRGDFTVEDYISSKDGIVAVIKPLLIKGPSSDLELGENFLASSSEEFTIKTNNETILNKDYQGKISLGYKENTGRQISLYGKVGINITNPEDTVDLEVPGVVKFGGKKFLSAGVPPADGVWTKGDITWNDSPEETGFIGWVCTQGGKPGAWKPFGYIGK
jgi:hypothetical protein